MRIQAKLFLFAILCSVLPLVATFALSFTFAKDSLTKTVKEDLLSQAKGQLESLQRKMIHTKHELGTLSELSTMQHVVAGSAVSYLQQDLDSFAARTPLFAEIIAADYSGVAVASTLPNTLNKSLSGTWEFEAPKLGINFDGRVVKSYRLGRNIATQSVPLFSRVDKNKIIGALIGSIDWEYLQQELAMLNVFGGKQSQQRQVFLESLESQSVLYSTAGLRVPVELFSSPLSDSGIRRVVLDGQEYKMVSIKSRSDNEFRDPQWRLHVLLDAEIAYASVEELKEDFLLAGALILLFVLALATIFASSIVTPVKSLVTGAERLSAGDYEYEMPGNFARDEIGQLTQSFNSMRVAVRRKEQELVLKTEVAEQASRLKGEFLANMSHEVRTPINGVLGMTELLLNTPLDETQSRYATTISRSGQSLLAVINDILDFSKIEAGKLELSKCAFDLRDLVEDVIEMVAENAHKKGVEVALHMPPGSHVAFSGDSARLRQVLLNLLSNAVKFTADGEVKLLVSLGDMHECVTRVTFKVVDTGIGIDSKNQEKIFDSFVQADGSTTRKFGGSGLGLAISKKLVNLMGGEIGVSSIEGKGSTFWCAIDLENLSSELAQAWRTPDSLVGKRVLIVDDNQTNREILETQVDYWGAMPFVVASAAEALHEIEIVSGTANMFDVAILDMHMPNINGMELADAVHERQLAPQTRLILLSSACDNLDIQTCHSIGIHSVVNKPVRQPDLYNCITAAINSDSSVPITGKHFVKRIETSTLRGRVLLAEDNPVNQDMMLEMLRLLGLDVDLAGNGEEVLSALNTATYDAILMDCQMPVLDGFAATNRIRKHEIFRDADMRVPIIALTANAMQGDKERCLDAGMDDYLSKPVSSLQLKETIGKWLGNAKSCESAPASVQSDTPLTPKDNPELLPVVNERVFSELLSMCDQASPGFYDRLVKKYDDSSFEDLAVLADAIAGQDAKLVGTTAHRFKSSTASWGAQRLSQLLQTLELAGKNDQLDDADNVLQQVVSEHEQLLQLLKVQGSKAA